MSLTNSAVTPAEAEDTENDKREMICKCKTWIIMAYILSIVSGPETRGKKERQWKEGVGDHRVDSKEYERNHHGVNVLFSDNIIEVNAGLDKTGSGLEGHH